MNAPPTGDAPVPEPRRYVEPVSPIVMGKGGRIRRWFGRGPGIWDLFAGVVAPVVLIAIDRPVLAMHSMPEGMLFLRPYSSILVLLSATVMVLWWKTHARPRWFHGLLAGALFAGATFAFGLAVVMTPLAILGLLILIGVLGFFPWITCAVFVRAATRAGASAEQAGGGRSRARVALEAVVGGLVILGISAACGRMAQAGAARATHTVMFGTDAARDAAITTLRWLYWVPQVNLDRSALRGCTTTDGRTTPNVWEEITGNDGESMDDW
jgi:hypothetical protein